MTCGADGPVDIPAERPPSPNTETQKDTNYGPKLWKVLGTLHRWVRG